MISADKQRTLSFWLPLPDPMLSFNSRIHWRRRAALVKEARNDAQAVTLIAMHQSQHDFPWRGVQLHTFWYFRDKRSYSDDDNLIGRLKAIRDGIADAGVVLDDKHCRIAQPRQSLDKKRPRLEIILIELSRVNYD